VISLEKPQLVYDPQATEELRWYFRHLTLSNLPATRRKPAQLVGGSFVHKPCFLQYINEMHPEFAG
jgi:hypothetical protein